MLPTVYSVSLKETKDIYLRNAIHGDIIVEPNQLRSLGVYFVLGKDEMGKPCSKQLIQKDETGSGYASVPLSITMHFEDPVSTYLPLLNIKTQKIKLNDWYAIELDAFHHRNYIFGNSGGKSIATNRKVVYLVGAGNKKGLYIWNPDAPDKVENAWKKITKGINSKYLNETEYYLTGKDIEKIQAKNRKLHETKFLQWLKSIKEGENLSISSIPEDINNPSGAGYGSGLIFLRCSEEGGCTNIITQYREYLDWDEKTGERNFLDRELIFKPQYLATDGPFGNILFWVNQEIKFLLNVPIWDATFNSIK